MDTRLEPADYLAAIRREGEALAEAARKGLERDVWSCPGWTVGKVVNHVARVHRMWESVVRLRLSEEPDRPDRAGRDVMEWYREGLGMLINTLAAADPEEGVYTWHPPEQKVSFWYRRMAHETLIHRVDVELGHGPPGPADRRLAADGIDEVLTVFMEATDNFTGDGEVLRIECTDFPFAWNVEFGLFRGEYIAIRRVDVAAGGTLRGPAADLDLFIWGRGPLAGLQVEGDDSLPARLRAVAADAT